MRVIVAFSMMLLSAFIAIAANTAVVFVNGYSIFPENTGINQQYENHVVIRAQPKTNEQLTILQNLMESNMPGVEFWREPIRVNRPVEILTPPSANYSITQLLANNNIDNEILIENVGKEIEDLNVGSCIVRSNSRQLNSVSRTIDSITEPSFFYRDYQRFNTYEQKLFALQREFSSQVQLSRVGLSYENRPLYLVKVSTTNSTPLSYYYNDDNNNNIVDNKASNSKPIILIDGLHHAREWISHSTAMWLLESLLRGADAMPETQNQRDGRNYNSNSRNQNNYNYNSYNDRRSPTRSPSRQSPRYSNNGYNGNSWRRNVRSTFQTAFNSNSIFDFLNTNNTNDNNVIVGSESKQKLGLDHSILDNFDVWFMPMINPDGYEHSQTSNRLWRKTMSANRLVCKGVDPNRNYPYKWRYAGASSYACDQTYAGPKPLSEPETATLVRVIDEFKDNIKMYLSLHAYSQVILSPWGYRRGEPSNYEELKRVAKIGMQAIKKSRGTEYEFGTAANLLYPAAGASDDYAYGTANISYAYTIELPDTGRHGFLLPANQIVPVGRETYDGVAAMIKALK